MLFLLQSKNSVSVCCLAFAYNLVNFNLFRYKVQLKWKILKIQQFNCSFQNCSCLSYSYILVSSLLMDGWFLKHARKSIKCRANWNMIMDVIIQVSICIFWWHQIINITCSVLSKSHYDQFLYFCIVFGSHSEL